MVAFLFLHSLHYPSKEQSKTVLYCSRKWVHLLTPSCDMKQSALNLTHRESLQAMRGKTMHNKDIPTKVTIRSTHYRQLSNKTGNSTAEEELEWRIKWLWNISISRPDYVLKCDTEISFIFLRRMPSPACFYIIMGFISRILYWSFSSLFLFFMAS